MGASVLEARDQGEVTTEQCMMLMPDYLAPSLDTTISAVGSAIWLLGNHPDQWDLMRADPSLIPNAVNEVVRYEAPIRAFGRITTRDTEIDGTPVPANSRVLVLHASANRDERQWDRPDEFDVTRDNAAEQLGFGYGDTAAPNRAWPGWRPSPCWSPCPGPSPASELAQRVGVSIRSLQEGFRRVHGTSPTRFLRDARLDRARALLLEDVANRPSVTDVAMELGFSNVGRFSAAHRERFGVLPSGAPRRRR